MSKSVADIVNVLKGLPPERVDEVFDFALFLRNRYHGAVDVRDEWSEEDLRDVSDASMSYAARIVTDDE